MRRFRFWATRAERIQLNRSEEEIVALIAKRKELEFDLSNARLLLDQQKQLFELEKAKFTNDFQLELARAREDVARKERELTIEQKPFGANMDITVGQKPPILEVTDGRDSKRDR